MQERSTLQGNQFPTACPMTIMQESVTGKPKKETAILRVAMSHSY